MDSLHQLETVILLLIAVLALAAFARKLVIPYPILLVIGGLVLGFIPGVPTLRLDPDVVFQGDGGGAPGPGGGGIPRSPGTRARADRRRRDARAAGPGSRRFP